MAALVRSSTGLSTQSILSWSSSPQPGLDVGLGTRGWGAGVLPVGGFLWGGYTHGVFSAPTRCQGVVVAGVGFGGSLRDTIAGLSDQDSLSTNLGKIAASVGVVEQAGQPIVESVRTGCPSVPPAEAPPSVTPITFSSPQHAVEARDLRGRWRASPITE